MGLFGSFNPRQTPEEAMQLADDVTAGRGLIGKLARLSAGKDVMDSAHEAVVAARSAHDAQAALAAGATPEQATVVTVTDTGQLVNFDPIVVMAVTLADGSVAEVRTLVSKLQIPRPGDRVMLIRTLDSGWTFVGLAA